MTALQIIVKDRCTNASNATNSTNSSAINSTSMEDSLQNAMSSFYMIYRPLIQLVPILPGLFLAWLGDRGWRKAPIVAPLVGFMLSRLLLLLMLLLDWPLEILWPEAILLGLSGGFGVYWGGTMALVSLGSTEQDRSKFMMRAELVNGLAGLVGCAVSGHLFSLSTGSLRPGVVTMVVCLLLYAFCLLYTIFFLQVKQIAPNDHKHQREAKTTAPSGQCGRILNIVLLLAGGILYNAAVCASKNILVVFELKEPLHWNAEEVGYGNASGFVIIISSFLGAMVMSRWVSDHTLITIGMLSFSTGIFLMAFVTTTYMFYIARTLTLFALIPMPIIRSLMSQQVQGSSYGMVLTSLQLSMKVSSVGYIPLYTKIYQQSLSWFPGFVFILSSIITILAIIPISILRSGLAKRCSCQRETDEQDLLPPQET
ncbi:solute carrier family 46 member 2-like [Centroberyx gerrardi]